MHSDTVAHVGGWALPSIPECMRAEPRVILLCEVLIVLISSASNAFNCARILELCSDFLRPVYDVISPEFNGKGGC